MYNACYDDINIITEVRGVSQTTQEADNNLSAINLFSLHSLLSIPRDIPAGSISYKGKKIKIQISNKIIMV